MALPLVEQRLQAIPDRPGVYLMKDAGGKVLYVGKANVLRNRVRSYFGSPASHPPKVRRLMGRVHDFEFIVTSRLGTIIGDDPEQVQMALSEIETAGPAVIPIIKRKLAEVREAARLVGPLEKLLREIECEDIP